MKQVTDSQFYMWRTLFAIAHADKMVSSEEVRFMAEAMEDVPFSPEQKAVLTDDIKNPRDIAKMFEGVTDMMDQAHFFRFARSMVHVDGDYGKEEQKIMLALQRAHVRKVDFDKLVKKIDLEFEPSSTPRRGPEKKPERAQDIVSRFRQMFWSGN